MIDEPPTMTRRHSPLLVLLPLVFALGPLCALSFAPTMASAAPAPSTAAAAGSMTMAQAVKMAEQKFHAQVIKAQQQKEGGKSIYVLQLLNKAGHVWTVHVDAATGSVQ
jgi:hypothetical protein